MDKLGRTPGPSVVVGVNGSGTAVHAVRWAAAEARRRRAPLRIVHAAPHAVGNSLDEEQAASILAMARTVAAHTQPRVPIDTECVFDKPAQVLTAATQTAQLLVVGMGARGGDELLVSSLALDVCATASCPVVIVRGPEGPLPIDGPVVLGVDDVDRDAAAITAAFAEAARTKTKLVVVHALRGPDAMLDAIAGHPASARAAEEEEITATLARWRSRYPGLPVDVRVGHGPPSDRLLEDAAVARLLVVGTHGRGQAARLVFGSISRAVVRHSSCPVMVVPRDVHVLDLEVRDTTPATSGGLRPHDRGELW